MELNKDKTIKELKNFYNFNSILIENFHKKQFKNYDWAALRYVTVEYIKRNAKVFKLSKKMSTFDAIDKNLWIENNSAFFYTTAHRLSFKNNIIRCFSFERSGALAALIEKRNNVGEKISIGWYLLDDNRKICK